jgi:hypothetical protein
LYGFGEIPGMLEKKRVVSLRVIAGVLKDQRGEEVKETQGGCFVVEGMLPVLDNDIQGPGKITCAKEQY